MTNLLADALGFVERRWSIIPIRHRSRKGKEPACRSLDKYKTEIASKATVKRWFREETMDGVAVISGTISGSLMCRDFDTVESYEQWAKAYPDLAAILPSVRTARGYHVYFTGDVSAIQAQAGAVCFVTYDDGELRIDGAYQLLPPSVHPNGTLYTWAIPLQEGPPPVLDPFEAGLAILKPCVEKRRSGDLEKKRIGDLENRDSEAISCVCVLESCSAELLGLIEQAIKESIPTRPRKRNHAVFDFIRRLLAIPEFVDADPISFQAIVKMWHAKAEPFITGENDWIVTWAEFVYSWGRVLVPKGENPIHLALARADEVGPPEIALQYQNKNVRRLIALCLELQRIMGSARFWITWEDAGKKLGIHPNTAGIYLNLLVFDGILKRHPRKSEREATRYNYLPAMEN